MRNIIFFCVCLCLFWSCSLRDDDIETFSLEPIAIESANVPNEFRFGEVANIEYSFFLPTTCHSFNDLFITQQDSIVNIAVIGSVSNRNDCQTLTGELRERSLPFTVNDNFEAFILNFSQGIDDNGESIFLTFEIPVAQ